MEFGVVKMEDTNSSAYMNSSLLLEFPYWQTAVALHLLSNNLTICGIVIFHILVLVALLRTKKISTPLNLIHASLLMASILEDVSRIFLDAFYLPPIFQHCICSVVFGTITGTVFTFFTVYRPISFACLGVLQLLVVVGKKRFINLKVACGMIAFSIGVGLIFVASTTRVFIDSDQRIFCYESYCPGSRPDSGIGDLVKVFILMLVLSFIPSLAVVVVTSTWSCTVFKKYYIGGDDQLNRRMLSLPLVMPLAIIASTVLEGILILVLAEVFLTLPLGDLLPYWILNFQSVVLIIFRVFTRLTYPLVLIYTHTQVREAFKKLFKRFKSTNRVAPSSSDPSNQ